jgi:hypothetical protein
MLTKILFTLLVIIGVALFYRNKPAAKTETSRGIPPPSQDSSLPTRTLAYILIGVLIAISIGIFAYNWHQQNRIVDIKVTSESGEVIHYQARHRDVDGRTFTSLEGINVTLGQSDRIEMLNK